jgi:uncharacterized OB-fold protein
MTPHLAGLIEPVIDADAVPFWDAIAEGRLVVPTCMSCGTTFYPPLPCCPSCQSELIEHVEAEGTGTLYSWVVMRRALDPAFADAVPYVVAAVQLTEGARLFSRLVDVDLDDPAALQAGMALRVRFVEIDGRPMWAFEPAAGA